MSAAWSSGSRQMPDRRRPYSKGPSRGRLDPALPTATESGSAASRASTSIPRRAASRRSPTRPHSSPAAASDRASVIDPLNDPLIAVEVVVQLAKQFAAHQHLPVLSNDRSVPPLGLDLPPRDRVDGAVQRTRDECRRAVLGQRELDRGRGYEQAGHRPGPEKIRPMSTLTG